VAESELPSEEELREANARGHAAAFNRRAVVTA